MRYICNPLNLEYRFQFERTNEDIEADKPFHGYREAADPSLICFKGNYYLFPSVSAGFWSSSDMTDWKFHSFLQQMPIYDYAPDVRQIGEYLYLCASRNDRPSSFYRTKDPVREPFEEIAGTFPFWDPSLFADDDGRIYLYWGCTNTDPIYGVELDPETMKPLGPPAPMIDSDETKYGYERNGEDHVPLRTEEQIRKMAEAMISEELASPGPFTKGMTEPEIRKFVYGFLSNRPYIEGAWMTKFKGKYYLQYAIPGTQYNVYADGVCVSEHPLGPFVRTAGNPFSYKPGGFLTGAGHGSTIEDKDGRYWHASTTRISQNHIFERRIGLWKAGFDADGELYCDQRYGDWPMNLDAPAFSDPEWMLLSYRKSVTASSAQETAVAVTDENIRTWWRAGSSGRGEWLQVDLGDVCRVNAVQINFAEAGITSNPPEGTEFAVNEHGQRYIDLASQRTRWLLEGSADGADWTIVEDKRHAETDLPHDFIVMEKGEPFRYLRLTIMEVPYHAAPCISGIRVFGKGNGKAPGYVSDVTAERTSDLDAKVSWRSEGADGAVVMWGHEREKLYHSRMVYGTDRTQIGALIKDQRCFIRVDTFNENGITEGEVICI